MKIKEIEIGMKVVPICKTKGTCEYGLESSGNWTSAKRKNQPFLYVNEIRLDTIVCGYTEWNGGDYFAPDDLISYEEEMFTHGEKVLVRDNDNERWQERIFIKHIDIDNLTYSYGCVSNSTESEFKNNRPFDLTLWKYCKKIKKSIEVKLNNEYTAIVNENSVKVECQTFTLEKIEELCEIIKSVKNKKKS